MALLYTNPLNRLHIQTRTKLHHNSRRHPFSEPCSQSTELNDTHGKTTLHVLAWLSQYSYNSPLDTPASSGPYQSVQMQHSPVTIAQPDDMDFLSPATVRGCPSGAASATTPVTGSPAGITRKSPCRLQRPVFRVGKSAFFLTEPCRKGPARVGEVIVVFSVSPHLHWMVARRARIACLVSNGRSG